MGIFRMAKIPTNTKAIALVFVDFGYVSELHEFMLSSSARIGKCNSISFPQSIARWS